MDKRQALLNCWAMELMEVYIWGDIFERINLVP
jgi:hypothetical protein